MKQVFYEIIMTSIFWRADNGIHKYVPAHALHSREV